MRKAGICDYHILRQFHVRAATLNVLLRIVDSLSGGTTRRSVLAERRLRRPGKSDTQTSGPK